MRGSRVRGRPPRGLGKHKGGLLGLFDQILDAPGGRGERLAPIPGSLEESQPLQDFRSGPSGGLGAERIKPAMEGARRGIQEIDAVRSHLEEEGMPAPRKVVGTANKRIQQGRPCLRVPPGFTERTLQENADSKAGRDVAVRPRHVVQTLRQELDGNTLIGMEEPAHDPIHARARR